MTTLTKYASLKVLTTSVESKVVIKRYHYLLIYFFRESVVNGVLRCRLYLCDLLTGLFTSNSQAAGVRGPLFVSPLPVTFQRRPYRYPSHNEIPPLTQRSMASDSKTHSANLLQRYLSILLALKVNSWSK